MKNIIAIVLALGLAACASDGGAAGKGRPVDPVQSVRIACASLPGAHSTFLALVKDQDKIDIEAKVKAGLDAICAHPEGVTDIAGAIGIISDGIARIASLQKPG